MRIIPVMDILNGLVVHAVRGERNKYQPIRSCLCGSPDPLDVAFAIKAYGFGELYVADLDALMGKGENFSVLDQIAKKTGLDLLVDTGVSETGRAEQLFRSGVLKVIVGTETMPSLSFVKDLIVHFGREKVIVSLDLKNGKVLSKSGSLSSLDPLALGREFDAMGVAEMILLDLTRVGSGEGVDIQLLKEMLRCLKIRILIGGGVRDEKDLLDLKDSGVCGVLLATALHSGRISRGRIKELQTENS